jgi:hypothetical protein
MSCPYCQEFERRGVTEPIVAWEDLLARNNAWSSIVCEILGFEKAKEIAERVNVISELTRKSREQ